MGGLGVRKLSYRVLIVNQRALLNPGPLEDLGIGPTAIPECHFGQTHARYGAVQPEFLNAVLYMDPLLGVPGAVGNCKWGYM